MKDVPIIFAAPMVLALLGGRKTMTRRIALLELKRDAAFKGPRIFYPSPWAKVHPGRRLWVKENLYRFGGPIEYAADGPPSFPRKMTPSVHCPRLLSRITLIVIDKRVERLQEITDADAKAEGVFEDDGSEPDIWYVPGAAAAGWHIKMADRPSKVFRSLWETLHGPESWDRNPDVIVLKFRVHKCNIDSLQEAA